MRDLTLCFPVILGLALPAVATDWPMLGHDALRSGATAAELRPPFDRKWRRLFPDEGIQSGVQPIIADGKVFLGTLAGVLHTIDAQTGKDLWSFRAGGPILHAAGFDAGKVFFGAADGIVYALRASDGKPDWRYHTGAAIWNAPAIQNGIVCIGGRDGSLYALDAASGQLRWRAETGAPLLNSPAIDPKSGRVYIGSEAMRVYAFSLANGRMLWRSDKLPGCSMRGYHPVIAPDGSVMVTTQPVISYDRFQELLLEMAREVFGDFASWRHNKEQNDRLRAQNFRQLRKPETYQAQLDYLRRRLSAEPAFQTFFVLDPQTGQRRYVAPIVASESMNGPCAPPVVAGDGRVIVKFQALLRSRYEHYSPFMNVGYLAPATGAITPLMDQTRTYGWHDSLLLVHDEQCQLSVAGRVLLNTHQNDVNALDLDTLKGWPRPFALNIHEPAPGEALAIRLHAWRGQELSPGNEWLIRGTAVYGGGSALDVPVAIAGDSFYYLPTHELNSGCALIAYRQSPDAAPPNRVPVKPATLSAEEWKQVQALPWDWDTLATHRLKNLLEALPGPVPGTLAAPLTAKAEEAVAAIPDAHLDQFIWTPAWDPGLTTVRLGLKEQKQLEAAVRELLARRWRPLVLPASKAPEDSYRIFNDPSETLYSLLLARPFLGRELRQQVETRLNQLVQAGLPQRYDPQAGESRVAYDVPLSLMRIVDDSVRDDLARLYPLWLWSRTPAGAGFVQKNWTQLRERLRVPKAKNTDDCGNSRLAGLIAYCRLAKAAGDAAALEVALPMTRQAMRDRLEYELAYTRGGVIRSAPIGRMVMARWRRLTPDVAALVAAHAELIERRLMASYVDYQRPAWWLAWNVEQLMRNEAPLQLPSTPLEIFTARALLLREAPQQLRRCLDLPWCRADEFYIQKLALFLRATSTDASFESSPTSPGLKPG